MPASTPKAAPQPGSGASSTNPRVAGENYEQRLVEWGLAETSRKPAQSPDGKVIDEILIASEDIVAPTDPYPKLLNLVHIRTKPDVIRRELLLHIGERYRTDLAEESGRNLRKLFILAIARVVPVQGKTPDTVALLVVTKDLWSIRLNSQFNLVGSLLQYLHLRPTEQNFLGLNHQLSLELERKLDTWAFGQAYADPRLFGTFFGFSESAALIVNRYSSAVEGSRGALTFQLPLVSLESTWSYGISGAWNVLIQRIFRGAEVWQLPFTAADGSTSDVPYIYNAREFSGSAFVTRSYGRQFKTNVSLRAGAYRRSYTPPSDQGLTDAQAQFLVDNYLPHSESAVYLASSVQLFQAKYAVLHNLKTFALSEDYQLGYQAVLTLRWAPPAISPSAFLEAGAALRYRWYVWGDLLTVQGAVTSRWVPGATGTGVDGPWVNRRAAAELFNATPFIGVGRIILHALWDVRDNDLNHTQVLLGGANGVRGLAPEALAGTNELLINLEYRTRAIELWTLHAGLVAFWDAGSAYTARPSLVHTVGIGLRLLFPQFDVEPVRIDFGFVLNATPPASWLDRASATFGQIEDIRPAFLDAPL